MKYFSITDSQRRGLLIILGVLFIILNIFCFLLSPYGLMDTILSRVPLLMIASAFYVFHGRIRTYLKFYDTVILTLINATVVLSWNICFRYNKSIDITIIEFLLAASLFNFFILLLHVSSFQYKARQKIVHERWYDTLRDFPRAFDEVMARKIPNIDNKLRYFFVCIINLIGFECISFYSIHYANLSFFTGLVFLPLLCRPIPIDFEVKLISENLDLNDVKENDVFLFSGSDIAPNSKVFKVDLSQMIEAYANNVFITLGNFQKLNVSSRDNRYFYFIIPVQNYLSSFHMNVRISYTIGESLVPERIFKAITIYIAAPVLENQRIPVISIMKNYHEAFSMERVMLDKKSKANKNTIYDKKIMYEKKLMYEKDPEFLFSSINKNPKYENLFKHCLYFNDGLYNQKFSGINRSKFLLHNGKFGNGKTTYDLAYVSSLNKKPIVISAWEANYDHDFLYYLFSRVREATKNKGHPTFKGISIFMFAIFTTFLSLYLVNKDRILPMIPQRIWKMQEAFLVSFKGFAAVNVLNYEIIIVPLIIFMITLIGFLFYNHHIIIFKKDYTKLYQAFFYTEIRRMMNTDNYMLIIEDTDRLSIQSFDRVIRTLSALNRECVNSTSLLGILSIDVDNIKETLEENDTVVSCNIEDIRNKILLGEVGLDYSDEESMIGYLKNILTFIKFDKMHKIDLDNEDIEEIMNFTKDPQVNFRTVAYVIDAIVLDYANICTMDDVYEHFKKVQSEFIEMPI